jgi:phosphatidylserine/phosphatidylglycerophosphate/cardiolipin synthase-like enzyme
MKRVTLLGLLLVTVFGFTVLPNSACCCVEAFFVSPSVDGVIESEIIKALDEAEKSIDIAMYSFTDDQLAAAVIRAYKRPAVNIRILLEDSRKNELGSEFTFLHDNGVPIKWVTKGSLFHHKFVVIDGSLTITGSYNWSNNADENNFENVVFITCEAIAAVYVNEFEGIWDTLE